MKFLFSLPLTLLLSQVPSRAWAIDRDACAVPYEQAQVLRKQRAFAAASEQLEMCRAKCPTVLAADCTQWAAELKALVPTVVFRLHTVAGAPIDTVRISVKGTLLTETPGETPVAVDPGSHIFRFESPGFTPTEAEATLSEGEHSRIVDVTLAAVTVPPVLPGKPTLSEPRETPRASNGFAYALGGVGAVGLLGGGGLAVAGLVDKAYLEGSCAPHCGSGSVETIRTLWTTAAVAAGVGAAAMALGVVVWHRPESRVSGWWAPSVGAGQVGAAGAF